MAYGSDLVVACEVPALITCALPCTRRAVPPRDKVAPLYYSSLELLSTLVAIYSAQLPLVVLSQGLEPLMPTLLHRVGNNNARIQVKVPSLRSRCMGLSHN